jgi:hypothetical protein
MDRRIRGDVRTLRAADSGGAGRVALTALVLVTVQGCSSGPAVIPTSYQNYTSSYDTFACDAPEGWEIKGGGKNGPVWAQFASGPADIYLKVGIAGSLMSDAMSALTNNPVWRRAADRAGRHYPSKRPRKGGTGV